MNIKRILLCAFLCTVLLMTSACSLFENDGSGHTFKIALDGDPENLDPQIAVDVNSISVAKNMFARLVRCDSNGKISAWAAKDYSISADGLTYTFYLNEGYTWKAAGDFTAPVTAHDFVFGFKRLFDTKTESPYAEDYYCIKNAEAAHKSLVSLDDIGVKALDDYTLEITLEYENAAFLHLLSLLPASPCNKEFFESCLGKYGLEADCIASNGPFYVRYWLHEQYGSDNYVRLSRNDGYSKISRVYPSGVTYLVTKDYSVKLKYFTEETTDVFVYSALEQAPATDDGLSFALNDETACLVFNTSNTLFSDKTVREIFSMALNRNELDTSLFLAKSIIAPRLTLLGTSLSDQNLLPVDVCIYNKAMAEYRWNLYDRSLKEAYTSDLTVLVPDSFTMYSILTPISDSWYKHLGVHVGIEVVPQKEYNSRIESGDYDIALFVFSSESGEPIDCLSHFGSKNTFGLTLDEVLSAEEAYRSSSSISSCVYALSNAQNKLLEDFYVIPICYLPTYCVFDDDIADLELDPFTDTVLFEKAKYY